MTIRPRRSVLYVPGSNPRALLRCRSVAADALVFDLEDSVGPGEKAAARTAVVDALRSGGFGGRERIVRVNGLQTEWGAADLAAIAGARPDAILLPKVATPGDIMFLSSDLAKAGVSHDLRLWAMVETPDAILNVSALARTAADPASRLDVLVMGTNDLMKETRVRPRPDRAPMLAWLSLCVAAARCHDLDIIDGVFNGLEDAAGLRHECEQGRDFGMDGKSCIHPDQVPVCNEVFSPSAEEVEWARRIVAAFAATDGSAPAVLRIDGRMVERLHVSAAIRTLTLADAIMGGDRRAF